MKARQIAWITGASSGIGKACALQYARHGYTVILSGRNEKRLQSVSSQLEGSGHLCLPFDMEQEEEIKEACATVKKLSMLPDILLLNAGLSQRALAIDTSLDVTKRLMKINFTANVLMTKLLLEEMMERKGKIGIITSVTGKIGTPLRSSYAASKHALHGYYDSLRAEVHQSGLSITLICPGYIKTNLSINALVGDGSQQNTMDEKTAKGMTPERLAAKIFKAIHKRKPEVYIGGFEVVAIYLKRYIPSLLRILIRKVAVK